MAVNVVLVAVIYTIFPAGVLPISRQPGSVAEPILNVEFAVEETFTSPENVAYVPNNDVRVVAPVTPNVPASVIDVVTFSTEVNRFVTVEVDELNVKVELLISPTYVPDELISVLEGVRYGLVPHARE